VWLTGHSDLRVTDHGGLTAAASSTSPVVPILVFDTSVHLRQPSLEAALNEMYGVPLIVRTRDASRILPQLASSLGAESCHVVEDNVEDGVRSMQRQTIGALLGNEDGVAVERCDTGLRTDVGWTNDPASMTDMVPSPIDIPSEGIPVDVASQRSLVDDESLADDVGGGEEEGESTDPPYRQMSLSLCDGPTLHRAIQTYVKEGRDGFANAYLSDALPFAGSGPWRRFPPAAPCRRVQR